jgi:Zn-dependent protease
MSKNKISLGHIFGIRIGADPSWFIIFALITWILASSYFPGAFRNWPVLQYWIIGAVTAILFFISVVLHELGHSIVALRYKIPVISITLFMFGGLAQIASEPPSAAAEFVIASAGPLTSFALAAIFSLLGAISIGVTPIFAIARYLASINAALALFNLIPGFPLDGGRVFRAIVWRLTGNLRRATEIAVAIGRMVSFLFIGFGVWQILQGNWANGLWIAFIGWFLDNAAIAQLQQQRFHDLLSGHNVAQAMSHDCAVAPADLSIQQLIERRILGAEYHCLMLTSGEEIVGLLTLYHLRGVPKEHWGNITAGEVMTPISKMKSVDPETGLEKAFEEMGADGVNQLSVISQGKIEGMLSRDDVFNYLHTLQKSGI